MSLVRVCQLSVHPWQNIVCSFMSRGYGFNVHIVRYIISYGSYIVYCSQYSCSYNVCANSFIPGLSNNMLHISLLISFLNHSSIAYLNLMFMSISSKNESNSLLQYGNKLQISTHELQATNSELRYHSIGSTLLDLTELNWTMGSSNTGLSLTFG